MSNHAELIRQENAGLSVVCKGRRFLEFGLDGGKTRHVGTIEPLHTRTTQAEIDTTWIADTGAWQWKMAQSDFQVHARDIFNVGSLIEWRHESDEWVIVDPQSINWINQDNSREQIAIKQAVTGQASDDTLTFPNAYGSGRHFSYTAHPKRLIKHFTIDSADNLPTPTITGTIWLEVEWTITNSNGVELYLDGVRWARQNNVRVRTSNRIEFRSESTGEALWYADAPQATDANGETAQAQYEVMRQGGTYFIRVRIPREWLLDAAYPVAVDPTFTDGYGGDVTTAKDTYLNSASPTYNYGAAVNIRNYPGAIEFDLSSIDGDATCDSATLYVYKYWAASTATTNVYSIASGNDDWPEGSKNGAAGGAGDCCWSYYDQESGNETAWAGAAGMSLSGTDYEAAVIGSFEMRADGDHPVGYEYAVGLTAARIEGWFGASNTNYGLRMYSSAGHHVCSSDHATTGYRPKLVVEYTAAAGDLSISEAESLGLADAVSLDGVPNIQAAESLGLSDAPFVSLVNLLTSIAEGLSVGDATTPAVQFLASVSDSLTASDAATVAALDLAISKAEGLTAADTASLALGSLAASIAESLGLSDAASLALAVQAGVADTVTVIDSPLASMLILMIIAESLSMADSTTVSIEGLLPTLSISITPDSSAYWKAGPVIVGSP